MISKSITAVAKINGILEDQRQEKLSGLAGIATNNMRKDPEYAPPQSSESILVESGLPDYFTTKSPPNMPSVRLSAVEEEEVRVYIYILKDSDLYILCNVRGICQ